MTTSNRLLVLKAILISKYFFSEIILWTKVYHRYCLSLLTPKDHVSRSKKDCFYVNKDYLLRSHTTVHDVELIKSGLNSFLTFGDVYRRDEIDAKHYPVFHQCDGVRIFTKDEVFERLDKISEKTRFSIINI